MTVPRVLIVSDTCISTAHGTGQLLLRQFSGYARDRLMNACHEQTGVPALPQTLCFSPRHARTALFDATGGLVPRIYNKAVRHVGLDEWLYHRRIFFSPPVESAANRIQADAVYSVAYGEYGFALTAAVCDLLPRSVPLIQYFLDYRIGPGFRRERYLRAVLTRATEVWALTGALASAIAGPAAKCGKTVEVKNAFCMDLPSGWKQEHRSGAGSPFRCVMLGNFWHSAMPGVVARLWRRVGASIPGLAPIEWYCHPSSVRRVEEAGSKLEPEIRPVGRFLPEEELLREIAGADLAILPFNARKEPENDYARYSLPSRLTELLAVGLPLYCIAGEGTPTARYLAENDLAVVCNAEDEEQLAKRLLDLMNDPEARRRLGSRARKFAEANFELRRAQSSLYSALKRHIGGKIAAEPSTPAQ